MGERTERTKKEKLKKRKRKRRVITSILVILIVIIAAGVTYGFLTLGKIKKADLTTDKDKLGINKQVEDKITDDKKKIKNIILLGIDQFEGDVGRSDAMIIATVDPVHNKLKLTSLMRDTYVNIPGHGYDKLTHAFAYGKEELAIKTINQNFGLNITDFVKVNFNNMEDIIDAVGGLDIEVRSDELENMNEHIRHLSSNKGITPKQITSPGMKHLNGLQALAYTRIRYTNGGDYERTERHRKVLTLLFDKVMGSGATKLPGMVNKLLPYAQTSLSNGDIIGLATTVLGFNNKTLEQNRFPQDGYCEGKRIGPDGIFYLTYDEEATKDQIFKYIFEDIKPEQKQN
jgi:LCP family protein required for cell wall assembly